MRKRKRVYWILVSIPLLVLTACQTGTATIQPTIDTNPVITQAVATYQAQLTQTAQSIPTPTSTPSATNTPEASPTPQASETPSPTKTLAVATVPTAGYIGANMQVSLSVNNVITQTATIYVDEPIIFRARVLNNGHIPLQVVANLDVPDGWDVDANKYSDCPLSDSLEYNHHCTISWYFTPTVKGEVILRVYVRGIYTDSAGVGQRITQSPAIIFNVKSK